MMFQTRIYMNISQYCLLYFYILCVCGQIWMFNQNITVSATTYWYDCDYSGVDQELETSRRRWVSEDSAGQTFCWDGPWTRRVVVRVRAGWASTIHSRIIPVQVRCRRAWLPQPCAPPGTRHLCDTSVRYCIVGESDWGMAPFCDTSMKQPSARVRKSHWEIALPACLRAASRCSAVSTPKFLNFT